MTWRFLQIQNFCVVAFAEGVRTLVLPFSLRMRVLLLFVICSFLICVGTKDTQEELYIRYTQWAMQRGAYFFKKVSIARSPRHGIGLFADEDIPVKTPYFSLPSAFFISMDTIVHDPFIGHLPFWRNRNESDRERDEESLAIFVMYYHFSRKAEAPHWDPYFELLPQSYAEYPLMFGEEEFKLLRNRTDFYEYVIGKREKHVLQFHRVKSEIFDAFPAYFPPDSVSLERWLFCITVVMSRIFTGNNKLPRMFHGNRMLPVADILNTRTSAEDYAIYGDDNFVSYKETDYILCETKVDVKAGDEIFNFYNGKVKNSVMYLLHGFVPGEDIGNDCVVFEVQDMSSFCISPRGLLKVLGAGFEERRHQLWHLINYFRSYTPMKLLPDTRENNRKVLRYLIDLIEEKYHRTDSVDFNASVKEHQRNILKFLALERRQMKKIISRITDLLSMI